MLLLPTQVVIAQSLSDPCLLSRVRGHAHLCRWLTAFQAVLECWLPILFAVGSVVRFTARRHLTSPTLHMSHRVTVLSDQQHNAFIGTLDHVLTGHVCSCENLVFFSDSHRYTLTKIVRCGSPSVSNRLTSPGCKRFTADFDKCGKLPITTIGFRSSNVAKHLAHRAGSLGLQPVMRSRTASRSMSTKLQLAASLPAQKTDATSGVSQLCCPSRIVSPCADWTGRLSARSCKLGSPASSAVLRVPRGPCTSPLRAPPPQLLLLWLLVSCIWCCERLIGFFSVAIASQL